MRIQSISTTTIAAVMAGALALAACSSAPSPEQVAVTRAETAERQLRDTQAQLQGMQQALAAIYGKPIADEKDLRIAHAAFVGNLDRLREGASTMPLPEVANLATELQAMADQLNPVACGGDPVCLENNRDFIRLNAVNALLRVANVLQQMRTQMNQTNSSREKLVKGLTNPYGAE